MKNKFKDIYRLTPAANIFKEKGFYTVFIEGTKDYYDFWDRERTRCLYGFTTEGDAPITITGYHYFYLNYCPIDRAVDEVLPDGTVQAKRERTFPAFYDGDYKYFHEIDKSRKQDKHMIVLKARRKGYSYKAGSMLARNYFFIKNSKNFVFAAQKS